MLTMAERIEKREKYNAQRIALGLPVHTADNPEVFDAAIARNYVLGLQAAIVRVKIAVATMSCERFCPDDIVNDAWLIWQKYLRTYANTPLYLSIESCLCYALSAYWRQCRKHSAKSTKRMCKRRMHIVRMQDTPSRMSEFADIALPSKHRQLLRLLCANYRKGEAAKLLGVSGGRITAMLRQIAKAYLDDKPRQDIPRHAPKLRSVRQAADTCISTLHETNTIRRSTPFLLTYPEVV
jgi:hypothetical protein